MTEIKKAVVCEPLKDEVLLTDRIKVINPKSILLVFWHGVGDLVMFLACVRRLQTEYSEIDFVVGVPKGLTHEELIPAYIPYLLVTGEEVNDHPEDMPFDLVAKITFPMSEGQEKYTKAEWCCIYELGITPVSGHYEVSRGTNRICAVHFQITCLPDSCNPDRDTAERIWNDILEAGWIPVEAHFEHLFHNPVNKKFDFVDCTVRRARPVVSSLVGLLRAAGAFVGVVSGNFHVALSVLPPERVLLLEKDFKKEHFTKLPIQTADLRSYQGEVKEFLRRLEK